MKRSLHNLTIALALVAGVTTANRWARADAYAQLESYDFGQSRAPLAAIQSEVAQAPADQHAALEAKLLAVIESPQAKPAAKAFACRMLRFVGSPKCIPTLTALLPDEQLSFAARSGLQTLPYPEVDAALRHALATAPARLKIGMITSLGQRRDSGAVPALAALSGDADPAIATAALLSLGQIGDESAAAALGQAKVSATLTATQAEALLTTADALAAAGKASAAAAIYQPLLSKDHPAAVRIAALTGSVYATKDAAAVRAVLDDNDAALNAAAIHLSAAVSSPELGQVLTARLLAAPPAGQVLMLQSLAADANRNANEAVGKLLAATDPAVQIAAIQTLGKTGDQTHVPALLKMATTPGDGATAALKSLATINAPGVDDVLVRQLAGADAAGKQLLLGILSDRNATAAFPAFLAAAEDGDPAIRRTALKGLGSLADEKTLPAVVALLVKTDGDAAVEGALSAACKHMSNSTACQEPVLAAMAQAHPGAQGALLRIAGQFHSPAALAAVRTALQQQDPAVQDAALRALCAGGDPACAADLLAIAQNGAKDVQRILALRGYMQIVQNPDLPGDTRMALIEKVRSLLTTPENKTMLLASLGATHNRIALRIAMSLIADPQASREAATTAIKILDAIGNRALTQNTAIQIRAAVKDPELLAALQEVEKKFTKPAHPLPTQTHELANAGINIAWQGDASSPDGWQKDGEAGGDEAGNDGDLNTYWDKDDNKPLYRYVISFPEAHDLIGIGIHGFQQENFAPRTFDIIVDGKVIKSINNTAYTNNYFWTAFPKVNGKVLELKITAHYGGSPAIRELEIYEPKPTH